MAAVEIEPILEEIVARLREHYRPEKVILFGSHSTGHARPDSDIDLLVIKDTPERLLDRCFTVRRILSDPTRMTPLEILVLTPAEVSQRLSIGDRFIAEILDRGKVLYAAS